MTPPLKHRSLLQELESLQHLLVLDNGAAPDTTSSAHQDSQVESTRKPATPKPTRLHKDLAAQLASMQTSLFETSELSNGDAPSIDNPPSIYNAPSLRARNPFRTHSKSDSASTNVDSVIANATCEQQQLIDAIVTRKLNRYREQLLSELMQLDVPQLRRYRETQI